MSWYKIELRLKPIVMQTIHFILLSSSSGICLTEEFYLSLGLLLSVLQLQLLNNQHYAMSTDFEQKIDMHSVLKHYITRHTLLQVNSCSDS